MTVTVTPALGDAYRRKNAETEVHPFIDKTNRHPRARRAAATFRATLAATKTRRTTPRSDRGYACTYIQQSNNSFYGNDVGKRERDRGPGQHIFLEI